MKILSLSGLVATILTFTTTDPSTSKVIVMASTASSGSMDGADLPPIDLPLDEKPGPHDHHFGDGSRGEWGGDRGERGHKGGRGGRGGRGGFGLKGRGGRLQLCPTGDCSQSMVDVTMHHLYEVDASGERTKNRIDKFGGMSYNWTEPATVLMDGINVTSSAFSAQLPLKGSDAMVAYNASVDFYAASATRDYAGTVVEIPAGGLKFSVWIDDWPFMADDHKLRLGLRIVARNGTDSKRQQRGAMEKGRGRDKRIERLALLDSMYIDSPDVAEVDGKVANITTRVATEADFVVIEYEFPKFKKLYYDPVVGMVDASESGSSATKEKKDTGNVRSAALSSHVAAATSALAVIGMAALMQL